MATRDLTPQNQGNGPYHQSEEGQPPKPNTGDPAIDNAAGNDPAAGGSGPQDDGAPPAAGSGDDSNNDQNQ